MLFQSILIKGVMHERPISLTADQTGLSQNPQVLRYRRLGNIQPISEGINTQSPLVID